MGRKKLSEKVVRSRRASKLRERLKLGVKITDDDREWLAAYEAAKIAEVAERSAAPLPRDDDEPASPAPPSDDATPPPVGDVPTAPIEDAPPPPPPDVDPLPPPRAPPLPRPPRPDRDERQDKKADGGKPRGDWRAKYNDGDASDGRETTCKIVADQWHGALKMLAEQIKASGVDPIVDPDKLYGAIVLTVDEIMPDHVRLSPRARALAGTTAIVVHRFVRRKEIAESIAKAKGREEHQKWQMEQARMKEKSSAKSSSASASQNQSAPSPPPPIAVTEVAVPVAAATVSATQDSASAGVNGSNAAPTFGEPMTRTRVPFDPFDLSDPDAVY